MTDSINRKLLPVAPVLIWMLGGAVLAADPLVGVAPADELDAPGQTLLKVLEQTLALDPNIALEATRVSSSRGQLLVESARFDTDLTSSFTRSESESPVSETASEHSTTLETTFGASRELRTGLTLEPSVMLTQSNGDPAAGAVSLGTLAFTLRQPLLRDRGRAVVTAGEHAAEAGLSAAELDLRHRISERVNTVAAQYWSVVAAEENLAILRTTESSARDFLANNQRLVDADVRPEAELVLLEADLADKESSTLLGEQQLFEAMRTLALEIGLAPEDMDTLPLPSDPLPTEGDDKLEEETDVARLVTAALARRADVRAARKRLEADRALLLAAGNALLPRLDFVATPGWTGRMDGSGLAALLASGARHVPGLSSSLGFELSLPTGNRAARGARLSTEAAVHASELTVALFERQIAAAVPIALDAVRQSRLQLERASRAVQLFEQAVANEKRKLQAGRSTLIDVISQRDRLTGARQTLVSARLALALALLDLRFQTGTLLTQSPGGGFQVRRSDLVTVPSGEGP